MGRAGGINSLNGNAARKHDSTLMDSPTPASPENKSRLNVNEMGEVLV
jgi:hypothetical protein